MVFAVETKKQQLESLCGHFNVGFIVMTCFTLKSIRIRSCGLNTACLFPLCADDSETA